MVEFINAKINIGLQIVRKREDGYHDLQTVFYPVGVYAGTAMNPDVFCDIIELTEAHPKEISGHQVMNGEPGGMPEIEFRGRQLECPSEKNLVTRAARLFVEETGKDCSHLKITLDKHLPDGAGLGGGSADATFTLRMLAEYFGMDYHTLGETARKLGADCPFFLYNRPVYAEGIGEKISALDLDLGGYWLVVVKPDIYVSTAAAFRGVVPEIPEFDLRSIVNLPVEEWRGKVENDFEKSLMPQFPLIGEIKDKLYDRGALYSSMTGSGSAVYGIFRLETEANKAKTEFESEPTIAATYLLKL